MPSLSWYVRRLRRMSLRELGSRSVHQARKAAWRRRQVRPGQPDRLAVPDAVPPFANLLRAGEAAIAPDPAAVAALLQAADTLLDGKWPILGITRDDFARPDWFLDPVTGLRAPSDTYAFSVDYRDASRTGIIKNIWEPSRHHQLTVLAAAYRLTGSTAYAEAAARQLRSWWAANPFLSGVHWTSGIEVGIRLVSWAWIRRLLDGWDGAPDLFEGNPDALRQLQHHQAFLAGFLSTGSSANNHVIAEAAGLAVAGVAFPWFERSAAWADKGLAVVQRELRRQTDPDGLNRELASEYQGLVLELALAVAAELALAGKRMPPSLSEVIVRGTDGLAAVVDTHLEPPRQGDGDDGYGLLLDEPARNRWGSLLAVGAATFGPLDWWPGVPALDVTGATLSTALRGKLDATPGSRPARRAATFASSGLTILRATDASGGELWCRLDAGPHGYLSIAAHAHADALSVELRHDGVDVLADPGTYCYHGDDVARAYFRSTLGHNTLELAGLDQSSSGGPFLWTRHAEAAILRVTGAGSAPVATWEGEHRGYAVLVPPAVHRRTVTLDREQLSLEVVDQVVSDGEHPCRLAWHLGPGVTCHLEGDVAALRWVTSHGPVSATLTLPASLHWQAHQGELAPMLGWYSPGFGQRQPATTLVGEGRVGASSDLRTVLRLDQAPRFIEVA